MQRRQQDFRAGDRLVLASGDHGVVVINRQNETFVTIAAAPGARPQVQGLTMTGAHWIIQGLDFQKTGQVKLVNIARGAQNVIFDHNRLSSQDDVKGWTPNDWATKAPVAFNVDGRGGTRCVTISNNDIRNVTNPINLFASDVLFMGNKIDHFGGDAIDYGGDNLTMSHNVITNATAIDTGQHIDAMQGFTPGGPGWVKHPYDRLTIDGNVIIRQADPNLAYPIDMQGIDGFSDDWTNLTIVNNVVVTNTYTGISFSSVHHGLIANNTVVSDEHRTVHNQPGGAKPSVMTGELVWIAVGNRTHDGSPSNDVVLRNNIAQTILISSEAGATQADHNVAYFQWQLRPPYVTRGVTQATPGPVGNRNRVDPRIVKGFVAFDPKTLTFDLHLREKSPAIGAGNSDRAPPVDANGLKRKQSVDLGAYAYAGS
ncbi:MAG TPA: right-handed parallel beta-helix repeat-containing protein [Caulobacteraceae bacterium]|jgi:hypothetical protein